MQWKQGRQSGLDQLPLYECRVQGQGVATGTEPGREAFGQKWASLGSWRSKPFPVQWEPLGALSVRVLGKRSSGFSASASGAWTTFPGRAEP